MIPRYKLRSIRAISNRLCSESDKENPSFGPSEGPSPGAAAMLQPCRRSCQGKEPTIFQHFAN